MPFKVIHDGTGRFDPPENCAFCRTPTRFWYRPRDVAVCAECAKKRKVSEVPTKREWIESERRIMAELRTAFGWPC